MQLLVDLKKYDQRHLPSVFLNLVGSDVNHLLLMSSSGNTFKFNVLLIGFSHLLYTGIN